jgi:hypothetical protein
VGGKVDADLDAQEEIERNQLQGIFVCREIFGSAGQTARVRVILR